MSSSDSLYDAAQEPRRRSPSWRRLLLGGALGFTLVAWLVPSSLPATAAGFVVMLAFVAWPRSETDRARRLQAEKRRETPAWPGSGMKAVVEALREPAFIVDRALLLRYRNPASQVAFGNMPLGDAISLRLRAPELLAALEAAVEASEPGRASFEERRPSDRTWAVEIMPIPAAQNVRTVFFLILFRDRTAERRLERMRTDFVANASHELRTPLASLTGFIETLQGPARNDPAARERFLGIMREQAARMSRLIDDLLSLSRIEMKRPLGSDSHTDLVGVFAKVREQLTPLADNLGLAILFDPPSEPFIVAGEQDELMQVFANLVENACKYGESGKRVELALAWGREGERRVVDASVRDFGPGIPAEHVPRLTERFYRVDIGSSRAKRGTGLGLSIVRNILLRHRARLLITSKVGEGSVFTARFPAISD